VSSDLPVAVPFSEFYRNVCDHDLVWSDGTGAVVLRKRRADPVTVFSSHQRDRLRIRAAERGPGSVFYYVFFEGVPKPFNPADTYSNDLAAFLVPTPVLVGSYLPGGLLARHFLQVTHWQGQAAYLGPGLWLTMFLFV
jgi:hypothetical protein